MSIKEKKEEEIRPKTEEEIPKKQESDIFGGYTDIIKEKIKKLDDGIEANRIAKSALEGCLYSGKHKVSLKQYGCEEKWIKNNIVKYPTIEEMKKGKYIISIKTYNNRKKVICKEKIILS